MEKVRKKLIREKAVIAVYQYLLTNSTEEEIMKKNNTLEIYKAEMKSIDAFWRQMVPFEYWKKASVWKKD